tara:strand:+ start:64 stop:387 length:324 start_codon:yes stop_codon:yes gene_type:complete
MDPPAHLHLDQEKGLTVTWQDGTTDHYPVPHLRRFSPSAEARQTRASLESNPLAVLPASESSTGPLLAENIEHVGTYAVRITFSDGHRTGLYTWEWLRDIAPDKETG